MAKETIAVSQDWVVPAGVPEITVKAWGAAGGGGGADNPHIADGGAGGGGGFVQATLNVVPGETLRLEVGIGGAAAGDEPEGAAGGAGGGLTGVFRGSVVQANALLIAGSGGGGAGSIAVTRSGGGGGGSSGAAGEPTLSGAGGTQDAGGSGGSLGDDGSALTGGAGENGSAPASGGGAGGSLNGGDGGGAGTIDDRAGGGGGGAGYYGGEGGQASGAISAGAGGGGSGFVSGITTTLTQAGGQAAANNADGDYLAGKGVGGGGQSSGGSATAGGDGYIVIEYPDTPDTDGRGFGSAGLAAVAADVVRPAFLIKAEFDSGKSTLWTGLGALPFDGDVYTGAGSVLGVSGLQESQDVKATGISISLSGVDDGLVALALTEKYHRRPCTVYLAFFDETGAFVETPVQFFGGRMDFIEIDPQPGGRATYVLKVESHLIDLQNPRPTWLTDADQRARHPGDTFLSRLAANQNRVVVWGPG